MIPATGNYLNRPRKSSFTFIELLFVIALIGVVTAVSLPGFRKTFDNLQLNSFTSGMQTLMNYLRERSIVTGEIISLTIDNENKRLLAKFRNKESILKTKTMPSGINVAIEGSDKQVLFYPDGSIDPVTMKITGSADQAINLTTKGIYGRVKLQPQE
jgi:general secretion pathway protein H